MPIDAAEVRRIARLARIELDEVEVRTFGDQLSTICDYVAVLSELDLDRVPPTDHAADERGAARDDEPGGSLSPAEATRNAADSARGLFRVPRVVR